MKIYDSCTASILECEANKQYSLAHLYKDEKPKDIHIHDNYEIYYSISGGKMFLIDNRTYSFAPGDIFFINQYESHRIMQIDNVTHERIIINIHPEFLTSFVTEETNINYCFEKREAKVGHRLSLNLEEQKRFLYYIHQLSSNHGYGEDILSMAQFLELMVFLNKAFRKRVTKKEDTKETVSSPNQQIDEILSYINQNIEDDLQLEELSGHFFISTSSLCRTFKQATGTTINKYINAKRITLAKSLLSEGTSVNDTYIKCGYKDYSNFYKAFKKGVGISPRQYLQFSK